MAINGAMAAGMQGDYSILISKSVIDGVTAVTFAAAMGVGVAFSAIPILVYEGGMTLIFGAVGQGIDRLSSPRCVPWGVPSLWASA